ncbi:hypothetical protein Sjap_023716 [Stephania japonica]|uniref:Uncharacterized protein n=1 Tax=Stephania japonica TaxID=461633 RepID=A0AAP0HKS1_9MAGN
MEPPAGGLDWAGPLQSVHLGVTLEIVAHAVQIKISSCAYQHHSIQFSFLTLQEIRRDKLQQQIKVHHHQISTNKCSICKICGSSWSIYVNPVRSEEMESGSSSHEAEESQDSGIESGISRGVEPGVFSGFVERGLSVPVVFRVCGVCSSQMYLVTRIQSAGSLE